MLTALKFRREVYAQCVKKGHYFLTEREREGKTGGRCTEKHCTYYYKKKCQKHYCSEDFLAVPVRPSSKSIMVARLNTGK